MKNLLSLVLALVMIVQPVCALPRHPEKTPQSKATHQIKFVVEVDGETGHALCTSSAIGPHALLTAKHCDVGETALTVDKELVDHKILGRLADGEDHVIFLVDGSAFKDTMGAFYSAEGISTGAQVFMFGDGGGMYPPQYRRGYYMNSMTATDKEVPEGMPVGRMYVFDLNIIGGDSGSAIYNNDGMLVSLVTYSLADHFCGAYPLAFTDEQIEQAKNFRP